MHMECSVICYADDILMVVNGTFLGKVRIRAELGALICLVKAIESLSDQNGGDSLYGERPASDGPGEVRHEIPRINPEV